MTKKLIGRFRKGLGVLLVGVMLSSTLAGCDLDEYLEEEDTVESSDSKETSGTVVDNTGSSGEGSSVFSSDMVKEKKQVLKGNGEDVVTILVYMNGSDLESDDGQGTTDIGEMVEATKSDKVNIIVETVGTKKWSSDYGIASDHAQRYKVTESGIDLVDDSLGQVDCTISDSLSDFIKWGAANYPADRYILQFWDHGGGPVYGFGYDQHQSENDSLTLDEMQTALRNGGVYFDFIGMDCCIMSCLETCCALYDYADYLVLSEDFESGLGWSYKRWLSELAKNSSIDTESLSKVIIDDMVDANENSSDGDNAILSLIDLSYTKVLYTAWVDFAYANEDSLLNKNYSQYSKSRGRAMPLLRSKLLLMDWLLEDDESGDSSDSDSEYNLSDYYITDIMSVAQNVDSTEAQALSSAMNLIIRYSKSSSGEKGMTGMAITLPYGDSDYYSMLQTIFTNCGFDSSYIQWLEKFVDASGSEDYYDFDDWIDDWSGWDDYEDDYNWDDWDYSDDDDYWDSDDWGWDDDCSDGSCSSEDSYSDDEYYEDDYYDDGYSDDEYYEEDDY